MNDIEKRVDKLEETHSFSEHTTDQLHEQLVRAHDLIDRLSARLVALEGRLNSLEHSATQSASDEAGGGGADGEGDGAGGDPNADIMEHFPPHGAGPKPG